MILSRSAVFVDSSGWIALLNQDDAFHRRAVEVLHELDSFDRPLVCTDWVFAETGNGLARTSLRADVVDLIRDFSQSTRNRLIAVDSDLVSQAVDIYERSNDKDWGLVDCLSFVVMTNESMSDALTTDRHFAQAGFRCLLRS